MLVVHNDNEHDNKLFCLGLKWLINLLTFSEEYIYKFLFEKL